MHLDFSFTESCLFSVSNKLIRCSFEKLCDHCSVALLMIYECTHLLAKGVDPSFKTL